MKATVEIVESHEPCTRYPHERLVELWAGRDALSVREYAELPVPIADRQWGMFRVWPEAIPKWCEVTVERSIRRSLGKSDVTEWEAWAEKWLSGEDRSPKSAWTAASTAVTVSRAAWMTARMAAAIAAALVAAAAAMAAARMAAEHVAEHVAEAEGWIAAASDEVVDEEREQQLRDFVEIAEQIYGDEQC